MECIRTDLNYDIDQESDNKLDNINTTDLCECPLLSNVDKQNKVHKKKVTPVYIAKKIKLQHKNLNKSFKVSHLNHSRF